MHVHFAVLVIFLNAQRGVEFLVFHKRRAVCSVQAALK